MKKEFWFETACGTQLIVFEMTHFFYSCVHPTNIAYSVPSYSRTKDTS